MREAHDQLKLWQPHVACLKARGRWKLSGKFHRQRLLKFLMEGRQRQPHEMLEAVRHFDIILPQHPQVGHTLARPWPRPPANLLSAFQAIHLSSQTQFSLRRPPNLD